MATWGSRGLRGSTLEDLINHTNEKYKESGLALIQKIPTPIKPISIEKEYIGVVQGVPVCFDAKETVTSTFPLHNIHAHQVEFMREFERQGGVAFIILFYSRLDEAYYLRFRDVERFWERGKSGGRKSFTYEELDKSWRIPVRCGALIHYLVALRRDLETRD